jgi:hypothetical protein
VRSGNVPASDQGHVRLEIGLKKQSRWEREIYRIGRISRTKRSNEGIVPPDISTASIRKKCKTSEAGWELTREEILRHPAIILDEMVWHITVEEDVDEEEGFRIGRWLLRTEPWRDLLKQCFVVFHVLEHLRDELEFVEQARRQWGKLPLLK